MAELSFVSLETRRDKATESVLSTTTLLPVISSFQDNQIFFSIDEIDPINVLHCVTRSRYNRNK